MPTRGNKYLTTWSCDNSRSSKEVKSQVVVHLFIDWGVNSIMLFNKHIVLSVPIPITSSNLHLTT